MFVDIALYSKCVVRENAAPVVRVSFQSEELTIKNVCLNRIRILQNTISIYRLRYPDFENCLPFIYTYIAAKRISTKQYIMFVCILIKQERQIGVWVG